VDQPEPRLEPDQTSLEKPENSCAETLPIQPAEFQKICREEWDKLPKYPRRFDAVIAAKGALTKY
jgi:hypothetical protein